MSRYAFKEFQSPRKIGKHRIKDTDFSLDDKMFRKSIHWYTQNNQNIQNEKQLLQKLAQQFNAVICLWRIYTENKNNHNIMELKSIDDLDKLPQFLTKALEVSKPIFVKQKFRLLSICIINKFGSFEAETCYSKCQNCGESQKLSSCCAQFACSKCSKRAQLINCPSCHKNLESLHIPLETVDAYQTKYVYQPMFPDLPLESRFELMDFIDSGLRFH